MGSLEKLRMREGFLYLLFSGSLVNADPVAPECWPSTYLSTSWFYGGSSSGGVWYSYRNEVVGSIEDAFHNCRALDPVSKSDLAQIFDESEQKTITDYLNNNKVSTFPFIGLLSFS